MLMGSPQCLLEDVLSMLDVTHQEHGGAQQRRRTRPHERLEIVVQSGPHIQTDSTFGDSVAFGLARAGGRTTWPNIRNAMSAATTVLGSATG